MDFKIYQHGEIIGQVSKEWLSWGDSYKVQIMKEAMETIIISLVIAIDCVKDDQANAAATVDIP